MLCWVPPSTCHGVLEVKSFHGALLGDDGASSWKGVWSVGLRLCFLFWNAADEKIFPLILSVRVVISRLIAVACASLIR